MKKLFAIKDTSRNQIVEGLDFELKKLAKEERRKLNGQDGDGKEKQGKFVVTLGIEHDQYASEEERKKKLEENATRRPSNKRRIQSFN